MIFMISICKIFRPDIKKTHLNLPQELQMYFVGVTYGNPTSDLDASKVRNDG